MELFHGIMFRSDNTEGYTQAQLDVLNEELALRIRYIHDGDPETAYQIAKLFADEVGAR